MDKFKNFKSFDLKINTSFLRMGESPEKDWKIIFLTALMLCVLVLLFSTKTFFETSGALNQVNNGDTSDPRTLNIKRLEEVVGYYEAKAAAFEKIRQTRSSIPDPSI